MFFTVYVRYGMCSLDKVFVMLRVRYGMRSLRYVFVTVCVFELRGLNRSSSVL